MHDAMLCFVLTCTLVLELKFVLGNIVVTSSYDGLSHDATHPWSVGLPELNVTFSNFSSGITILKELNLEGLEVFRCAFSARDGVCNNNNEACPCSNMSSNSYESIYTIKNLTNDNKNLTSVVMETNEFPPVRLAEAIIFLTTCPSQEPAEPDNSTLCTYNHFNCPTQFYCRDPYVHDTVSSICLADTTWNASISCTKDFSTRKWKEEKTITGGVLLGLSLAELLAFVILIVLLGFIDFIKENTLMFISGAVLLVIANVCGIVLIASATDDPWSGGDIAAAVIGYIALAVVIPFEIYLGHSLTSDYAKGHKK